MCPRAQELEAAQALHCGHADAPDPPGLDGYLFVLSGFTAGGNTMQMGGASIGAYALYFVTLYYTK